MTREQIETLITDNITTNSNGEITAVKVKTILDAIANDYRHSTDEITLSQVTDLVSSLAGKQATLTATNIKTIVDSLVEMTTPIDADKIIVTDSAGTTAKKLSWTNIKAFLKTYFDTLYQVILISGTNIKTVNGSSILGSGDLVISSDNIYTANGTLTANRTVSMSGNSLTFTGGQTTVKGSGTTSATKSLSIQNSSGTELVISKNNGDFELNVGTGYGNIVFTSNGGVNRSGIFGYNMRIGVDSSKCLSFAGGEGLIGTYNHSGTNTFASGSGVTDANVSFQLANQFTTWFYARNGKNIYMTDSASNYKLGVNNTFWMQLGTAPTSGMVDHSVFYVADQTAGNACLHTRTENGAIIKLYQETTSVASSTFVANIGNNVKEDSSFDGYTVGQVVKALRNLGILG
jgi:hypothetical protein